MVAALAKPGRTLAKRLITIEIAAVIFVAAGMALSVSIEWAIASFIGGAIIVTANMVFSLCAFLFVGARAAKLVAALFYTGEVLKILITVALFSVVLVYTDVELVPLTLTYLLVLGIHIFAPVFFINNNK
jgi:ATP synthase protein I